MDLVARHRRAVSLSTGIAADGDWTISAPYEKNRFDRQVILDGFAWLDEESARRFKSAFCGQ